MSTEVVVARARRVLVVDDHRESRLLMSLLLERRGHTVAAVSDPDAAIAALSTFGPDTVLLEWNLRSDRGVGLAIRLRNEARQLGLELHIVATSTQDAPDLPPPPQFDAYLRKPIDIAELERVLADSKVD